MEARRKGQLSDRRRRRCAGCSSGLADLTLIEPKTERPELFARLDLDDPANGKATESPCRTAPARWWARSSSAAPRPNRLGMGNDGVYVRRIGENRAGWRAARSMSAATRRLARTPHRRHPGRAHRFDGLRRRPGASPVIRAEIGRGRICRRQTRRATPSSRTRPLSPCPPRRSNARPHRREAGRRPARAGQPASLPPRSPRSTG